MAQPPTGADTELTGEVLSVRCDGREPGDGRIELATASGLVARCRGPLAGLVEGESVTLLGAWHDRPGDGRVFEALAYQRLADRSADVRRLLSSARFDVIGVRARQRVVTTFGTAAGRVIEREPSRLIAEAGLDPSDAARLHAAWAGDRALVDLVRLVAPAGWPLELTRRVHDAHGSRATAIARDDPFALVGDAGVRFGRADALARHLGVAANDARRLAAGARAAVDAAQRQDGHVHVARSSVVDAAARLLGVDGLLASEGIDAAVASGWLGTARIGTTTTVSTPQLLAAERRLVDGLVRLVRADAPPWRRSRPGASPAELSSTQRDAVRLAIQAPVSIVTGSAGTGTAPVVAAITRRARIAGLEVTVCAATRSAAAHLAALIGHPVVDVAGFVQRQRPATPATGELVLAVDADRYDTSSAGDLVDAVADGSHLVVVGDPHQLPSARPGAVLHDLMACGAFPVTELVEVRPDQADRRLVSLAQEVLAGEIGALPPVAGEVFVAAEPQTAAIVDRVVRAVVERIPSHLGVDAGGVRVLSPAAGGAVGSEALAAAISAAGGPPGATATTIQAAAGGSWPVIVLVCDATHRSVLSRRALYTALTRAQRAAIIVGQPPVVREAAAQAPSVARDTGLPWLLRSKLASGAERGQRAAGEVV